MTFQLYKWLVGIGLVIGIALQAGAMPTADFDYKVFFDPKTGPYVETWLAFDGSSIKYSYTEAGLLQGKVEVLLIFRQNDSIVLFDKKELLSPENAGNQVVDFIDQQRYSLAAGNYVLDVELRDLYADSSQTTQFSQPVTVPSPPEGVFISDLELVAGYKKSNQKSTLTKAGYDLIPYLSDKLPAEMQELVVYCEVYRSDQHLEDSVFVISYYFSRGDSASAKKKSMRYSRKQTAPVVPVLLSVPLEELSPGAYDFVMEARNAKNEVVASRKIELVRLADEPMHKYFTELGVSAGTNFNIEYESADQLHYYVNGILPIAGDSLRQFIRTEFKKDYEDKVAEMEEVMRRFWTDRSPANPTEAWQEYLRLLEFTEQQFGTQNKPGYETDRGIAYIKYGAPDDIVARPSEPNSYPYQIWRYYKADKWNNAKLIFYDPQLTGRDYILLHVEGIPGEMRNPHWRSILQSRTKRIDPNKSNENNNYGSEVDDLWNNPR